MSNDSLRESYNDSVVRQFTVMTVVWGIVGMLVGVIIAAQLYWPTLFEGIPGSATAACGRCTPTR
jgi:cytochrome c oxidase cbb3-type subunit 1